jgi:Putative hemolysin
MHTPDNSSMQIDIERVITAKAPKKRKYIPSFIINRIKKIIHQDEINDILSKYGHLTGVEFASAALKHMGISYTMHGVENIDKKRRYIIASNHPMGGLDGLIIIEVFGALFKNVKFVVNDILYFIEPLKPVFLPINKYGKQNHDAARMLNDSYNSDDQILYFPAGLCSRLIGKEITDIEWRKSYITQAIKYNRDILPLFFDGKNSKFFYRFAKLRSALRIKLSLETALLPHEMFKKKGSHFNIYVGDPICCEDLKNSKSVAEWNKTIRDQVYKLREISWNQ